MTQSIQESGAFIRQGNVFIPLGENASVCHVVPNGVYTLHEPDQAPAYMQAAPSFILPERIYGDIREFTKKVLFTYEDRRSNLENTGVLLSGSKGDGKSMIAKVLVNDIVRDGVVIYVNRRCTPSVLATFVSRIVASGRRVCVFCDEFEKTYPRNDQRSVAISDALLAIMDGGFVHGVLFVFTANETKQVSEFMMNRPGRIFYHRITDGVSTEFVSEYANDQLVNKAHLGSIFEVCENLSKISFDSLKALIKEMNRYGVDAFAAIKDMNISSPKLKGGSGDRYTATIMHKGENISHMFKESGLNNIRIPNLDNLSTYLYLEPKVDYASDPMIAEKVKKHAMEPEDTDLNIMLDTDNVMSYRPKIMVRATNDSDFIICLTPK